MTIPAEVGRRNRYRSKVLAALAAFAATVAAVAVALGQETPTRVVLLGTGTPQPDPERWGPSVAIDVGHRAYIVDSGVGVVRQAVAASRKHGIPSLEVRNLSHVFVTHLHSDHTLGLADLLLTPWIHGRESPLHVYGREGLSSMMDHLRAAYERDIYIRLYGAEPANNTGHKAVVHEVEPGIIFEDESATITAFAVRHGTWPTAFGYKFETNDRSIVVSGDAAPSEEIIRQCSGCDVLVHEVYLEDEIEGISTQEMDWAKYFRGFHTSATELGQLAARAKPELLVLYHKIVLAPETEDDILKEIRKSFKGNLISGRDLDVF